MEFDFSSAAAGPAAIASVMVAIEMDVIFECFLCVFCIQYCFAG